MDAWLRGDKKVRRGESTVRPTAIASRSNRGVSQATLRRLEGISVKFIPTYSLVANRGRGLVMEAPLAPKFTMGSPQVASARRDQSVLRGHNANSLRVQLSKVAGEGMFSQAKLRSLR